MTTSVERGWVGQGRSWWKGGCQCTRGYMCVTLFQCVGQVSIVSLCWHQPKAINALFDWKALGVICKQNTINRYKIKVFCLLIWLRWLCSEIWTFFLKEGKRIWVLVWTSSKCWDYHVFKLMPIPRNVCLIFYTGCDIGLLLFLKVTVTLYQVVKDNRLNRTIKTLREKKWYCQSHEPGDQIWCF